VGGGGPLPPTSSEVTTMTTTCDNRRAQTWQRIVLRLVALAICSSCDTHRPLSNAGDGGPGHDVALAPVTDVADGTTTPSPVDAGPDLLPLCCSGPVLLSPVGPDAPCSFTMPGPPPPTDKLVLIYLNKILVDHYEVDGGYPWSSDPMTSTVVFTGVTCDSIMASPNDSVVQLLCSCWEPVPPCPGCP
jgi:hypothetical protein